MGVLVVVLGSAAAFGGIAVVGSAVGSGGGILSAAHRVAASPPSSPPSSPLSSPPATASTRCAPEPSLDQPTLAAPPALAVGLHGFLADPRVAPHAVGMSVWIDGYGEVLAHDADRMLVPASNQKLFTAMGALAVLGADTRLKTELRMSASGDLVIVPGGDPTITSAGVHSVAALAAQLRARGIGDIPGSVLVDESRHDAARRAPGWQDWQIPAYTGPLSAFMVDDNRWRSDAAFVADPALANAERLRSALLLEGIAVAGGVGYGRAGPGALVVATLESPPVRELVHAMLLRSDNQIADMLLKEIGFVAARRGSLADGAAATRTALAATVRSHRRSDGRRLRAQPRQQSLDPRVARRPPGRAARAVVAAAPRRAARRRPQRNARRPAAWHARGRQRPGQDRDDHRRCRPLGVRHHGRWSRRRLLGGRQRPWRRAVGSRDRHPHRDDRRPVGVTGTPARAMCVRASCAA